MSSSCQLRWLLRASQGGGEQGEEEKGGHGHGLRAPLQEGGAIRVLGDISFCTSTVNMYIHSYIHTHMHVYMYWGPPMLRSCKGSALIRSRRGQASNSPQTRRKQQIHIHICIYVYTHTQTQTYISIYIYKSIYVYIYIYACPNIYICIHICMYTCILKHLFVRIQIQIQIDKVSCSEYQGLLEATMLTSH